MIVLSIAVGLSVDYIVHITRSFLEQVGTRQERVIKALAELGPPVFHSGFSTFLAIVILAFSKSYIFKSMFWGFFTLIVFGMLHGLVFGPILLSFIGPASLYENESQKEQAEKAIEERVLTSAKRDDIDDSQGESQNVEQGTV